MPKYQLYGIDLDSEWRLPCPHARESGLGRIRLEKAASRAFRDLPFLLDTQQGPARLYQYSPLVDGSLYLRWPELFEFRISADGSVIQGHSLSRSPSEAFHSYMLGHVISFAMLRQGIEHYHCSAVVINGAAVGFLGNCGYGKSTLTASFVKAGYRLLSDDILVLRPGQDGRMLAYPGSSRLKLYPVMKRSVLGRGATGTRMNPMTSKLIIGLPETQMCPSAVPVKAMYALSPPTSRARSGKVVIRRLSERRALLKIIQGTFNNYVTDAARLKSQFFSSREIASKVPVRSISYPRIIAALGGVRAAILSDLDRG